MATISLRGKHPARWGCTRGAAINEERRAHMTPEEQLDRLIEQGHQGTRLGPVPTDEVAARLAAAEALARLQAIEIPPAFARRLEARIRTRARDLAQQRGWEIAVPRPQQPVRSRWLPLS